LVALLVALLPAPGCARRYTVKSALLSSASLRADECRSGEAIDTGEKDCDGLPIYELRCPGRPPISGAIWCHKGDCFVQQMAGRCWK
jgi:hypothetical protein